MNYFHNYHIVNDSGKNRRAKIRWLPRVKLEEAVVRHVIADLTSPVFIRALLKEACKMQDASVPALRMVDDLEKERTAIIAEIARQEQA